MIRNRKFLKAVAAFMILETLLQTVAPTISWALTSGPTAPEATSFEAVDTTDMVNLFTGDLAYNTPLLEVPGPNGGYPLSLSYHAGIQPNVDASWVGLGWTLNPGAISRIVNGYADDDANATVVNHMYHDGRSQTTYTVGLTVPVGGAGSVTAGMSFTQDSQLGFSANPFVAGQMEIAPGLGIQASSLTGEAQLTGSGIGQMQSILAAGSPGAAAGQMINQMKNKSIPLGPGLLSRNGYSAGTSFLSGLVSLGVDINSKGIKPKMSIAGYSKESYREGKINKIESNAGFSIPTPIGIVSAQRKYVRIWIDETTNVSVNGSLYFPTEKPADHSHLDLKSYDTYNLYHATDDEFEEKDPQLTDHGSFIDYDDYRVNAQGLNGSFRPYHYYEYLHHQNRKQDETVILQSVPIGATNNNVEYRFINDFSNRFLFDPTTPRGNWSGGGGPIGWEPTNPNNPPPTFEGVTHNFDPSAITAGLNGQGYENNTLAGSRHIKVFTNNKIINDKADAIEEGFLDCTAEYYYRGPSGPFNPLRNQVGSFKITNESGVTYHFALPAYSRKEYSYTERIEGVETYNSVTKDKDYAYTWYLTAITGPDYVDRGGANGLGNGKIDKDDYGYWVEFGYRRWNDTYYWRNPVTGYNIDLDQNFQSFSRGEKQIYYIDFIRTASHIAVFDKGRRLDGRGVANNSLGGLSTSTATTVAKLDNIYVLSFADFEKIGGFDLLDDMDANRATILDESLRSVKFQYDYSLCKETLNSFTNNSVSEKQGKLTLNALKYYGEGGEATMLPPMKFGYELQKPITGNIEITPRSNSNDPRIEFYLKNSTLQPGDIMEMTQLGVTCYAVVLGIDPTTSIHKAIVIHGTLAGTYPVVEFKLTKNPPFNKEKYDAWGLYKSDFIPGSATDVRNTTPVSARGVDVWSLRTITTPTGSTINLEYEPDYYDRVVLSDLTYSNGAPKRLQALRIRTAERLAGGVMKIYFHNDGFDLNEAFSIGNTTDLYLMGAYLAQHLSRVHHGNDYNCPCPEFNYAHHDIYQGTPRVLGIQPETNSITVDGDDIIRHFDDPRITITDTQLSCPTLPDFPGCTYDVLNSWVSFFAGGIAYTDAKPRFAGGIRVKQIAHSALNKTHKIDYTYHEGVTSYEPVSILAFKLNPDYYNGISEETRAKEFAEASKLMHKYSFKHYSKMLSLARELPAPGVTYPTVDVKTSISNGKEEVPYEAWQKFDFQTYTAGMLLYSATYLPGGGAGTWEGLSFTKTSYPVITLDDLTQAIGNLKSISNYDQHGNLKSSTRYSYLHDNFLASLETGVGYTNYKSLLANKWNSQGVVNESFADARIVRNSNVTSSWYKLIAIMSKRRTYPSIKVKEIHTDYTTGITAEGETLAFDFFSGAETKTLSTDGWGNAYVSEMVPAYTLSQYQPMGLGMYGRKNMLVQPALEYVYKVNPALPATDPNYKQGLVSASVQTWSNEVPVLGVTGGAQPTVWRKHASFTYVGDQNELSDNGLLPTPNGALPTFNAWERGDAVPANWIKGGETMRYDYYSRAIEGIDMNNTYGAVKVSGDQFHVIAAASNASLDDFTYTGAEEAPVNGVFSNDVKLLEGAWIAPGVTPAWPNTPPSSPLPVDYSHTGSAGVILSGQKKTFEFVLKKNLLKSKGNSGYRASVWWCLANPEIRGPGCAIKAIDASGNSIGVANVSRKVGNWVLVSIDIPAVDSDVTIYVLNTSPLLGLPGAPNGGGSEYAIYVDDFRVSPVTSSMNSFVYDKNRRVTAILDNENLATSFTYDADGNLSRVHRETFDKGLVIVSESAMHYGAQ